MMMALVPGSGVAKSQRRNTTILFSMSSSPRHMPDFHSQETLRTKNHRPQEKEEEEPHSVLRLRGEGDEADAGSAPITASATTTRRRIFGILPQRKNPSYGAIHSNDESIPFYTNLSDGRTLVPMVGVTNSYSTTMPPSSPLTSPTSQRIIHSFQYEETIEEDDDHASTPRTSNALHETRHAQSLLLGIAFCSIWSSSNIMAPQLTNLADEFNFENDERDLYLGSYMALAVSVFSFPIAGIIGIATDVYNRRKLLFCSTILCAGIATLMTSYMHSYTGLLFFRWITGGFMAGSVPVAFSFLSDLFNVNERNAASSGLTAMMGLGIISGQVYSGFTEWRSAFWTSGAISIVLGIFCFWLVVDPVRGGTEKAIQDLLAAGTTYERKLNVQNFTKALTNNASNGILLWQGFFSSLPWGVIFVFLNDFLSQERGFSIPDATYLVAIFGVGCAAGGILGGTIGQVVLDMRVTYLPLFMAATTVLGILPFVVLLNSTFTNAHGILGFTCAFLGGLIASLPSVNVRPCLINVNLPETRGASMTAANLLINLGRGVGPSCVTLIQSIFGVDRKFAFNVTLILFWVVSGIQLLFLMKTLPADQDAMEAELEHYVRNAILDDDSTSVVSIEDRRRSFDMNAARETVTYVRQGIQELRPPFRCSDGREEGHRDGSMSIGAIGEDTPLVVV